MFMIRVFSPHSDFVTTYKITELPCTVGRSILNHVVIDDSSVSAKHAIIEEQEEGLVLTDRGSRNGTFSDGQLLKRLPLKHRTQVQLGEAKLEFIFEDDLNESTREIVISGRPQLVDRMKKGMSFGGTGFQTIALSLAFSACFLLAFEIKSKVEPRILLLAIASSLGIVWTIAIFLSFVCKIIRDDFRFFTFLRLVYVIGIVGIVFPLFAPLLFANLNQPWLATLLQRFFVFFLCGSSLFMVFETLSTVGRTRKNGWTAFVLSLIFLILLIAGDYYFPRKFTGEIAYPFRTFSPSAFPMSRLLDQIDQSASRLEEYTREHAHEND